MCIVVLRKVELDNFKFLIFLGVLTTISLLYSCKNKLTRIELLTDYPVITISSSMGDNYRSGHMSLIGNLGYLVDKNSDSTEVLIISRRIDPGIKINYNPIGVLVVGDNTKKENIIVATTPNSAYTSVEIKDLSELSIHFGYVKRIIEQWYTGLSGLGGQKVMKWEGKAYVSEILKD